VKSGKCHFAPLSGPKPKSRSLHRLEARLCAILLVYAAGADAIQVKSVSESRLVRKLGQITAKQTNVIAAAIALCVGY
jgi:hypothetical protein